MSFQNALMRKLLLNALAGLAAALGLASTYLAYTIFGIGGDADLWMLGTAVTMALALLAQLGVEQVGVFYSRTRHLSDQESRRFARDSLLWSYLFGALFACGFALLAPWIAGVFAPGFAADQQKRLASLLWEYWPLILVAPSQYVLKQLLLIHGRSITATSLNLLFPGIHTAVLVAASLGSVGRVEGLAGQLSSIYAVLSAATSLFLADVVLTRQAPHWRALGPFIVSSFSMRVTHSLHGLLVTFVSNQLLSFGAAGTIAVFQYARKVAEGLVAVTVGPHGSVYHARQSAAWASRTKSAFAAHIRDYLASIVPLLAVAGVALAVGIAYLYFYDALPAQLDAASLSIAVAILFTWQIVIAVETIPVGVLALESRYKALLVINGLFICSYYFLAIMTTQMFSAVSAIALSGLVAQLQSVCLFAWTARSIASAHWRDSSLSNSARPD